MLIEREVSERHHVSFPITRKERGKIFELWVERVRQILDMASAGGFLTRKNLSRFFHSLLDSLEGKESFRHFQLLFEYLPELRKHFISEHKISLAILELRSLIIRETLSTANNGGNIPFHQLSDILSHFDDILSFIQKIYILYTPGNEPGYRAFQQEIDKIPLGIFRINGPRFQGNTEVNTYLTGLCKIEKEKFAPPETWFHLIHKEDLSRLSSFFSEQYRNQREQYQVYYRLQTGENRFRTVREEGEIRYLHGTTPSEISGIILPVSSAEEFEVELANEREKLNAVSEVSEHFLIECNSRGKILSCNAILTDLLQVDSTRIIGSRFTDWLAPSSRQTINSFRQFIQSIREKRKLILHLRGGNKTEKICGVFLRVQQNPNGDVQYLIIGRDFSKELKHHSMQIDFNLRLKQLIEIQKELSFGLSWKNVFNRILNFALKLIPAAQAGSVLKIEEDGMHYVAAHGYNLKELQKIILLRENHKKFSDFSTQTRMLLEGSLIKEIPQIKNEARHILSEEEYQLLKNHGRLDEIQSTLSGLILSDGKPFAILNLDNFKDGTRFTENDKNLFDIYLQQVAILLNNFKLVKQIQESEANYRSLFENSPLATCIYQDGRFKIFNRKFLELTGYSEEEIRNISAWELVHPDDVSMLKTNTKAHLKEKFLSSEYEFRAINKGGKTVHCMAFFSLIHFQGKRAILAEISDISTLKFMEKKLLQAQKMETIGTLTAGLAHDFNNIIGAISPTAEMIMLQTDNSETRRKAEIIYQMAQRAGDLTNQLLTFSRPETTNRVPVNLNTLIRNNLPLLEKSAGVKIKIRFNLAPDLKFIQGDPTQFTQILINLIVNARDAMPEGGTVRVCTRNVQVDETFLRLDPAFETGTYVQLSISDSGIGLSPDIRDKIFDPFFTTKNRGKGTGLGLSMVYGITKNYKGVILVESEEGKGTTFELFFPATLRKSEEPQAQISSQINSGTGTILVVDDENELREVVQAILEHLGYRVYLAGSGAEAIDIYSKKKDEIDMVLLDYIMPEMDGKETYSRLKKINPAVKVLICSGYSEQDGLSELIHQGITGIITKPFTLEYLSRKIQQIIPAKE